MSLLYKLMLLAATAVIAVFGFSVYRAQQRNKQAADIKLESLIITDTQVKPGVTL